MWKWSDEWSQLKKKKGNNDFVLSRNPSEHYRMSAEKDLKKIEQRMKVLERYIDSLNVQDKKLVRLRYFEEYTLKAIAKKLKVSEDSLRIRYKGIDKILESMEKDGE